MPPARIVEALDELEDGHARFGLRLEADADRATHIRAWRRNSPPSRYRMDASRFTILMGHQEQEEDMAINFDDKRDINEAAPGGDEFLNQTPRACSAC